MIEQNTLENYNVYLQLLSFQYNRQRFPMVEDADDITDYARVNNFNCIQVCLLA